VPTVDEFESVPYHRSLGLRVETVAPERVRVRVPFKDENSNPGRALHGGVAASTIGIAGTLAASAGLGDAAGLETRTLDLAVTYLAAAIGEDIVADAEVLRRGKEIVYADVGVRNDAGKWIAKGLVTFRAAPPSADDRQRHLPPPPAPTAGGEIPPLARAFVSVPFIKRLGMTITQMHDGTGTLRMPFIDANADADGAVHEGALAAFLDTAGAVASWSIVGLDFRLKASTVGIHVSYHARAVGEDVVAHSRTLMRTDEIFANTVTLVAAASERVVATGSVTYRIVVP
jgi:uncharacterized protein (TIGR00369 family)